MCFWEDDLSQLRRPTTTGANRLSLIEAQGNVQLFGACDQRGLRFTRRPLPDEPLDPLWRPIDPQQDSFEDPDVPAPWPDYQPDLYWWRPSFWRRRTVERQGGVTQYSQGAVDQVVEVAVGSVGHPDEPVPDALLDTAAASGGEVEGGPYFRKGCTDGGRGSGEIATQAAPMDSAPPSGLRALGR